ncbi:hypothetical protein Poly51_19830 [Rubripirellula tenax]|uniref:Anaphase-promoting complex, cyclosome, subunit 3 n=1 Tax=Rubripirellula tenax TaxID=2528015 RepID=A0A5C6FEQ0_9BACT|nr:hypothetical protein [Rubripirellula tenax]TWU59197.1 hypothetical protein Poly51_19830 [Rubripirellula tenax]
MRILTLLVIVAFCLPVSADQKKAEEWMAKAVEASKSIHDPSAISHAAAQSARVHARLGQVDAAFEAAKQVSEPQLRLYALRATVQAAVDAERDVDAIVDEAKRTLQGNEGAFNDRTMNQIVHIANAKEKTILAISPKADERPLLVELQAAFDVAETREAKMAEVEALANHLLRTHSFDALERVIEEMVSIIQKNPLPDQSSKFGVYGDTAAIGRLRGFQLQAALILANDGDYDEAARHFAAANPVVDTIDEQAALVKWQLQDLRIRTLLKLERADEATKHLAEIRSPMIVSSATAAIAAHHIELGDVAKGLKMAQRIGDEGGSGVARAAVAIALLHSADEKQAVEYLNALGESNEAASAFVTVARHWVETANAQRLLVTYDSLRSPVARANYAIAAAEFLILSEHAEIEQGQ